MPPLQASQATDRGKVRPENEDRALVEFRGKDLVVAVADGVGGERGGAIASETAVSTLAAAYFEQPRKDPGEALASAMKLANDAVLGAAEQQKLPGAATTVVAAAVRGRKLAIANLGDSRAYVWRRGGIRQVTTDHTGSRARSITRFAGDPRGVHPDMFVESLDPGDRLLLCSDGVTNHVPDADLGRLVGEGDADMAAQRIVRAAVERGGLDNATAVVVVSTARAFAWDRVLLWAFVAVLVFTAVTAAFALQANY